MTSLTHPDPFTAELAERFGVALDDLVEDFAVPGVVSTPKVVSLTELPADADVAADLRVRAGEPVIHLQCLLLADGEQVALRSTSLPAQRFRGLLSAYDERVPLRGQLREAFGVGFGVTEQLVWTVLPTHWQARLFGITTTMPLLCVHSVSQDLSGRPVERTETLLRGDRVRLSMNLVPQAVSGSTPCADD